jgi:hypothetical protein
MADNEIALPRFSFRRRPIPVPGDLRIAWRVALILLMLGHSRANRASLAKLHILNDAIRSNQHHRLEDVIDKSLATLPWSLRVEPAFARAIDYVVGEHLAAWTIATGRTALRLTASGVKAFGSVTNLNDTLIAERVIIAKYAKAMPENLVANLLGEGRGAA